MFAYARLSLLVAVASLVLPVGVTRAHFLWLVRETPASEQIHLVFSETAAPDNPDLLDRIRDVDVWQLPAQGEPAKLTLRRDERSLTGKIETGQAEGSLFVLQHTYGVVERGGETFLLRYHAKTGPRAGHETWTQVASGKFVDLDLVPEVAGPTIRIRVLWQGKPLADAQVVASGPGLEPAEMSTNSGGEVTLTAAEPGVYSIRARHSELKSSEHDGKPYASIRHYATLALNVTTSDTAASFPELPEPVTSFGAAVADGYLYVYGGHTGHAHAYSDQTQAHTLRRLNLRSPKAWEELGSGPGLQGHAMVAHRGKLYRLGGFMAKNKEGEAHQLWSVADVACYDPRTEQWSKLSPLPEPRSSFDAAVLGDRLYAIGGWQLSGGENSQWHETAYAMDLAADRPQWKALPAPPFQRRALSVAAFDGKIYVIGGMQSRGGPTTRVDVLDPAEGRWSQAPNLKGEPMNGFGSAAFATGGRLYVSTYSGQLQRLAADGQSWEVLQQLERARFFHRMLPLDDARLIVLGGASMQAGKFSEIDILNVR